MRRFSCIVGSVFLAMSEAQAELVINGSTISSSAIVPVVTSEDYTPNNNFQSCLANLRSQAIAAGVSGTTYDRYTQNLTPDYSVIDKLNYQPEFSTPIWDYLSGLVDEERVELGKQKLAQHRDVLNRASQTYGVPPETIVAVWGVESNFGDISGKYPLLQALGTLSCEGRRQSYFRTEFFATMRILQRGDLTEDQLKGSWAGAFGHTQFMPSTYERLAVDFDGDGRRDLVSSTADALASTANFLKGGGPFVASWPTDDPGTSRAERREIQQFLINRGYDIGAVDGLIGDKTRVAIRQEQTRLGLNPTGRAGQQILRAFRQEQAQKMMQ